MNDRLLVQKSVYLGQVATNIDLGYRFGWYKRGAYCPELTRDYYALNDVWDDAAVAGVKRNMTPFA